MTKVAQITRLILRVIYPKGIVMFNRELQMKVVKTNKKQDTPADTTDVTIEGKVAIVTYTIDRVFRKIGIAVCAYVVLDTLRQVLVASAGADKR